MMKLIYFIFSCFLLDSSLVTGGLLDAIDDLLGTGGSKRPSRTREPPRYEYNSNEQSIEDSEGNTNNNDNRKNGLLSNLLGNRPINFNGNPPSNGQINLNNLLPSNRPNNLNNNNVNGFSNHNNNQEDQDKLVAQAFPEGVALLDRLKELNRLKAEGKLNIGSANNNNKNPTYPLVTVPSNYPIVPPIPYVPTQTPYLPTQKPYISTSNPYVPTQKPYKPTSNPYIPTQKPYKPTSNPYVPTQKPYVPTSKPYVPTAKPDLQTPEPNGEQPNDDNTDNTAEDSNAVEVKDFYFQAQPVVPVNEKNGTFPLYIVE